MDFYLKKQFTKIMMKKFTFLRTAMMLFASVLFSLQGFAQGISTSSINGLVQDNKGEALPGATVVACLLYTSRCV